MENKIKIIPPAIAMKSFLFLVLPSFLFLSLDGVSDWIRKGWAQGPNSCAYIGILPSRMHLVVITTHYWLLQFISGHYHPLTTIQFGFQNWQVFSNVRTRNYYMRCKCRNSVILTRLMSGSIVAYSIIIIPKYDTLPVIEETYNPSLNVT